MKDAPPKTTFLKDYTKFSHTVSTIDLVFELDDEHTKVTALTKFQRDKTAEVDGNQLRLNGEELKLLSIKLNGKSLQKKDYSIDDTGLTIYDTPDAFELEVVTEVNPLSNTSLDGLYKSGDLFCTQNEPEGFRRITYFPDRPDVMAKYTTKIIADKKKYPILLSNGNRLDSGDSEKGKHWVLWEDPFLKPCYLYALVAGDLGSIEDSFTTRSGRVIALKIYCDKGNEGKCHHAMRSLKKSMQWDEDVFGLEYDLDIFMIVAVDAFNFGAMENKGLNIFNTSCVLADEKSATDDNFTRVEGVVAHEYFHNWTGNRVTCRDWFQLTLKEGLTVFRDQEFSSDMNSRPVKRIEDVIALRTGQFAEDAGPTSHPIKPKSYIEINNFYTTTIYNKGAEIIRMIQTLIGKKAFVKGIETYFSLFDGQAVTTEDFLVAMEKASGMDLKPFMKWYHQSGTPELEISFEYDEVKKEFVLDIRQINKATADQKNKESLYFPLRIGLIGANGQDLPVVSEQAKESDQGAIIIISKDHERFVFKNVTSKPVPSINRGFSAPVVIKAPYTQEEKIFLMRNDSDSFNRWDSAQELSTALMLEQVKRSKEGKEIEVDKDFIEAFGVILNDTTLDRSLKAWMLSLPTEGDLGQRQEIISIDHNYKVREFFYDTLAERYFDTFVELYHTLAEDHEFSLDSEAMGRRSLKNLCLRYAGRSKNEKAIEMCFDQFLHATNMTDEFSALTVLANQTCPQREQAIKLFYDKWKSDTLVMCKWLSVQAGAKLDGALVRVTALMKDPVFNRKIPNLVRALYGSFVENHRHFHQRDGAGYDFIAQRVLELDKINPHVAARIAGGFKKYKKLDHARQESMKHAIEIILDNKALSPHVYEIVSKCMG